MSDILIYSLTLKIVFLFWGNYQNLVTAWENKYIFTFSKKLDVVRLKQRSWMPITNILD